jgi:hypothetical protein
MEMQQHKRHWRHIVQPIQLSIDKLSLLIPREFANLVGPILRVKDLLMLHASGAVAMTRVRPDASNSRASSGSAAIVFVLLGRPIGAGFTEEN